MALIDAARRYASFYTTMCNVCLNEFNWEQVRSCWTAKFDRRFLLPARPRCWQPPKYIYKQTDDDDEPEPID